MPPHNRQGAGADEKTFGPPPRKVNEKPFTMPEDPYASLRGRFNAPATRDDASGGQGGPEEEPDHPGFDYVVPTETVNPKAEAIGVTETERELLELCDRCVSPDGLDSYFISWTGTLCRLVVKCRAEKKA